MRNKVNLSHLTHLAGQIGRVQTISVIPVIPGDSLQADIGGIIRLAPTRKEIVSECQVDILAFYVKHRHLCDTETAWANYVYKGPGNINPNPFTGIPVASGYRDPFYLGIKECGATVNRFLVRGNNFIMARNFLIPNTNTNGEIFASIGSLDFYPTNETWAANMRKYGPIAARLPHILNGGMLSNGTNAAGQSVVTNTQWGVQIPDTLPNVGLLDIRDLADVKSRYKTQQKSNWYAQFYDDILEQRWQQGGVNSDADKRPDYLGRATFFLSGKDVDGTDDATLGSFVGKTLGRVSFNMKRRVFKEHGNVWFLALLRYPMLHTKEQHPLLATAVPDTDLWLGDPAIWQAQAPVQFNPGAWLAGGSIYTPNDQNLQPYGQEYRYQPNRVHPNFETIPGYPFTSWDSATGIPFNYYFNDEYKDTFQTSQIGQWQWHCEVNCTKLSLLPNVDDSIMAGAN